MYLPSSSPLLGINNILFVVWSLTGGTKIPNSLKNKSQFLEFKRLSYVYAAGVVFGLFALLVLCELDIMNLNLNIKWL